jgi:hypothetical protein
MACCSTVPLKPRIGHFNKHVGGISSHLHISISAFNVQKLFPTTVNRHTQKLNLIQLTERVDNPDSHYAPIRALLRGLKLESYRAISRGC